MSIKFPERGLVFILGKSGSGKSTLLNVLGGLDQVDKGEIIIKGKSSKDFSQSDFDSYRNTYLGFVFQEYNILNEFSVGENIALALQLQGKNASKEEITKILDEVDLKGFADRKPNELSGGQKQRIAIARALIKNPPIILADEPTGALDSRTGIQIFDTLKSLSQHKLVIVVSHDREFAEQYGDRVIELKDGKIISDISKFKEKPEQSSEGVVKIDEDMFFFKKGHVLTDEDIRAINQVLSQNNTFISSDDKTNKDLKRVARIDEQLNREAFKDTDPNKIVYSQKQNFNTIKSSLPLKNSIKIGVSALKTKPFRLFLTILLSFLSFAIFGVVNTISTYSASNTVYDGLKNRSRDQFVLSKQKQDKYDYNGEIYYNRSKFSDADITEISNKYGITPDIVLTDDQEAPYDVNCNVYLSGI